MLTPRTNNDEDAVTHQQCQVKMEAGSAPEVLDALNRRIATLK
jgi:hypothetical protein